MNTLNNAKSRVAFAVCRSEPEHDPEVDKSTDGQFWLFSRLNQAQEFIFSQHLLSEWQIVPVLLTVPKLPTAPDLSWRAGAGSRHRRHRAEQAA